MNRNRLLQSLNRRGTRWAAHLTASAVMTSRGRALCIVRPAADDLYAHRGRRGSLIRDSLTWHLSPSTQEDETLDIFCHAYMPQAGDVVLDVGAGTGEETLTFSRLVGPTGRVISVEAHPHAYRQLRMLCQINGLDNVIPLQYAVADTGGITTVDDGTPGWPGTISAKIGAGHIEVEAVTIDALAADLDRVDLLKMNIEGAEQLAIRGMTKTVCKMRHAVISCHDFIPLQGFVAAEPTWFTTYEVITTFFRDAGFTLAPRRSTDDRSWVRYYVYASR